MKNAKKILERKRKIIVVLVVMVSFVSVLTWYQMKKAHAYQSYNTVCAPVGARSPNPCNPLAFTISIRESVLLHPVSLLPDRIL